MNEPKQVLSDKVVFTACKGNKEYIYWNHFCDSRAMGLRWRSIVVETNRFN